jgi:AcrR family transcriptional regulator
MSHATDPAAFGAAGQPGPARGTTRPVRMPRSLRRQQLLSAAQEIFVAQGYHAAAMDDIAERAGVSKPVLYQHFPGKLELYLALLDTHCDALVATVRNAMASTTDNKVRVRAAMQAYFDFVDGEGEAYRLVFESDLRNEPAVRERMERAERGCMEAVAETIMADTKVDRNRAELLAIGLTGAAETAARFWLGSRGAVPKEDAVSLIATLSWRGISGFPLYGDTDLTEQS